MIGKCRVEIRPELEKEIILGFSLFGESFYDVFKFKILALINLPVIV
jgi:hypothetical protein